MTQQPLPGLEDVLEAFMGAACWPALVAQVRELAEAREDFTVDDLVYSGSADARIKGAALMYLHRAGEISPVETTRTIRPSSHSRPIVRWTRRK